MKIYAAIVLVLGAAALSCLGDVFSLKDGSQLEGTVTRTSPNGRVSIKMRTGVRTYHVSEFTQETRDAYLSHVKTTAPTTASRPGPRATASVSSKPNPTTSLAISDPKAKLALVCLIAGCVLCGIGGLWMTISAFAESPVWGIAFLMSGGVAELAFMFVHWERAKAPIFTQVLGLGLCLVAILVAQ